AASHGEPHAGGSSGATSDASTKPLRDSGADAGPNLDAGRASAGAGARSDASAVLDAATPSDASALSGPRMIPPVACSFEPVDPNLVVDNTNCPNGIYQGDITITGSADIARLKGCTRVRGSITVESGDLQSLEGLESLRVVEGDLEALGLLGAARECFSVNPTLKTL